MRSCLHIAPWRVNYAKNHHRPDILLEVPGSLQFVCTRQLQARYSRRHRPSYIVCNGTPTKVIRIRQQLPYLLRVRLRCGKCLQIAVHCHAGYGRTGLVIASILVFIKNLTAEQAIALVRDKRPGSLQTRSQVCGIGETYIARKLEAYGGLE